MPVHRGRDSSGSFYQWGSQKKYYYNPNSERSQKNAKAKAIRQGVAVHASGWHE